MWPQDFMVWLEEPTTSATGCIHYSDIVTFKAEEVSPLTVQKKPIIIPLPGGTIIGIELGRQNSEITISGVADYQMTDLYLYDWDGTNLTGQTIVGDNDWDLRVAPFRGVGGLGLGTPRAKVIHCMNMGNGVAKLELAYGSDGLNPKNFFVHGEPVSHGKICKPFPTKLRLEQIARYWYQLGALTLHVGDVVYKGYITGLEFAMTAGLEDRYNFKLKFAEGLQHLSCGIDTDEEEPCPDGQHRDPETGECVSCPDGTVWNGEDCVPIQPNPGDCEPATGDWVETFYSVSQIPGPVSGYFEIWGTWVEYPDHPGYAQTFTCTKDCTVTSINLVVGRVGPDPTFVNHSFVVQIRPIEAGNKPIDSDSAKIAEGYLKLTDIPSTGMAVERNVSLTPYQSDGKLTAGTRYAICIGFNDIVHNTPHDCKVRLFKKEDPSSAEKMWYTDEWGYIWHREVGQPYYNSVLPHTIFGKNRSRPGTYWNINNEECQSLDLNNDGIINSADLLLAQTTWGVDSQQYQYYYDNWSLNTSEG
jgi:hypothetical protein